MRNAILILSLTFVIGLQAQNQNVFLNRTFWQADPTIEVIDEKITKGNDVSALNSNGFDAVTYAILANTPNHIIKYLLSKKGNEVNKLTHDKRTYVFWAAYKGNLELIEHLIVRKARLDLRDSHNFSPLTFAAVAGQTNPKIYDLFIAKGIDIKSDVDEHGANALLLCISQAKDFTLVNYFISKGLTLESLDNEGNGAFNYAAKTGNKDMLKKLIQKELPYKNLNKKGGNAMLNATKGSRKGYNSLDFFKYLEELGVNPNVVNKDGETPLHNLAFGNKEVATFNYFITKGVDVNQVNKEGNTALMHAVRRNNLEIITLLAVRTKNLNHINNNGQSALTKAINNSPKVVDFLLKEGADVHMIDKKGNNLGYYLIKSYKDKEAFHKKIKLLSDRGLELTKPQRNGNTLYHLAVEEGKINLLKIVKGFNIDINAKNKAGLTALHQAVMSAKDDKIIKYVLSIGADKTIKTDFEESVYDLAKENELLQTSDINFLR